VGIGVLATFGAVGVTPFGVVGAGAVALVAVAGVPCPLGLVT